jgi:phage/plasmid-like protein (TIGR03299 family)
MTQTIDQAFTTREAPWMKVGTKLVDEPVSAAEAAKLGGIDFRVVERSVYWKDDEAAAAKKAAYSQIPERKALVREDTGEWLGLVSSSYPVVQYGEAFDFMDSISPHFVAAGGLRKFKQAFMVVRAPETFTVLGNEDPHELFAVLRTSHDCSRAVEVMVMPLRGRCMNQLTLTSFRKGVPHRWVVTHTGDVKSKLAAAHDSVKNLGAYAETYTANVQRLADISVTVESATQILTRVLPDRPQRAVVVEKIVAGWQTSPAVGYPGTGWGLVNAVSEYFDWQRPGGSPESRFLAAIEGQTHKAINKTTAALLTRAA